MKKIITAALMIVALNVSAFFNNGPWTNNGWNNTNNGFIEHNPYSMFTPDWFSEEMDDMVNEFDNNNTPWSNNNFNNRRAWNNPGNNANNRNSWRGNNPWQNRNQNQVPWQNPQPLNMRNNSFGAMNNGPWNHVNRATNPATQFK
ncbi:hypothetical protein [Candidatus Thioglobus sp.]|uniref:hypothetical protein n=1 Tax=Candidatus Thioglobus sp. TaxID=2026721 RepID=UPI003D1281BA